MNEWWSNRSGGENKNEKLKFNLKLNLIKQNKKKQNKKSNHSCKQTNERNPRESIVV